METISEYRRREKLLYGLFVKNSMLKKSSALNLVPIEYSEVVIKYLFEFSNEIRIFDKNLDRKIWDSKEIFNEIENQKFKLLLNELPYRSRVSDCFFDEKIFKPKNVEIRKTDFTMCEENDKFNEPVYFVIGDEDKVFSYKGDSIKYCFNDRGYSREFIKQFDSIFNKAEKL